MEKYRTEHDSMGEVSIKNGNFWGANTERSRLNFKIGRGHEHMPVEVIRALAIIKSAAATANNKLQPAKMTAEKCQAINNVAQIIIAGELDEQFPLVVFQTGSGTQTNMNVNEVIANVSSHLAGKPLLHPNDDVNMSQSSNDVFPSAMHIAAVIAIENDLLPAITALQDTFLMLEKQYAGIMKSGRTHLQDATPMAFSDEISGWRASVETAYATIKNNLAPLRQLAIGGTAVGNGINAPVGFGDMVADIVSQMTNTHFEATSNKFHLLTSKSELVAMHGAIKSLAMDMHKIANDVRLLASGPRCGIGEISIPENEPGSSIMPGKVNPTQCEAMTMVAAQVLGNDAAISFAAAMGQLELNVYMPVIIYDFLQSVRLLADALYSFNLRCVAGITPNEQKMQENLSASLMRVTALTPLIGYEKAAQIAKKAHQDNTTLKAACIALGYMTEEIAAILD